VVLNDGPPAAEDAASAHTVSLLLADENRVFRPDPELPDNFPFADDPLGMQITPRGRLPFQQGSLLPPLR